MNFPIHLILASGNPHKAREFSDLLKRPPLTCSPSKEKSIDVEETGDSFFENAQLKAYAYYKKFQSPILADDSGLVVDKLPDALGVHSARFGGAELTDRQRVELLLKKLDKIPHKNRQAHFVCVLCFYLNPKEIFFFEGRLHGHISDNIQGEYGFGYDSIFLPEISQGVEIGRTLAMIPQWKAKYSHRAEACRLALRFFSSRHDASSLPKSF